MSLATNLAANLATESNPPTGIDSYTVTLSPPTVLDSSVCREFWEATQRARDPHMKLAINLGETASIHDSGYTLLWMVKDSLAKKRANLLLTQCPPPLKKALQLRGFDDYFTFS